MPKLKERYWKLQEKNDSLHTKINT
jgi:hypothetical protein